MTRQRDIRKSNFVTVTSTESTDYFDIVRNGQNFKIQQANLVNDFGVSGTIETRGEVSATPVLKIIGDVNYIRNLFAGPGILLSDTPQDAIQIEHNFYVDSTGVPIITDEALAQPRVRSIQAGTGITVAGAGDVIQISTAASPGSSKTVYVYQESDFPAASLGVITLADDTEYRIQTDITTTNRFIMGAGTVLSGPDGGLIALTYTGVGIMFSAIDKSFTMKDITTVCTAGTLFDVSSTTGLHDFALQSFFSICLNVGTFDHIRSLNVHNSQFQIQASGTGLAFANACSIILIDTVGFSCPSGTGNAITLGSATFDIFNLHTGLFNFYTSGYLISGLASSGNINSGGLGSIALSDNLGSSTFSNNISPYDDRWEMSLNGEIENSTNLALATRASGTVTITTALTPVIIGATWTDQQMHRFTGTAGGRWTYTGKGMHASIDASISGARSAVGTDTYGFYLYKNGVQITASLVTRDFTASIGSVSLIWATELATSDYLEIWIENRTSTQDFTVDKIVLKATG